jgi:hypothetical protein
MTPDREKLYAKVRALLAKTQENGCTEQEAMAALAKARAMMDAYEISDDELQLTKAEKAIIRTTQAMHDKYGVRQWLHVGIGMFCNCKTWWSGTQKQVVFCGLPADVDLANWLLDSLEAFVRRELVEFLMNDTTPRGYRRRVINGFVFGCTARIRERLADLMRQSEQAAATHVNSRALVVVRDRAIAEAMETAGVRLRLRTAHRKSDDRAHAAGKAAGERASFGRPVGGEGGVRRLT